MSQLLQLLFLNKWLQSLHEVFLSHFLTLPLLLHTSDVLGRDEDVADNVNHTVPGNAIFDCNGTEPIDLNSDEPTVACNIDTQGPISEECW